MYFIDNKKSLGELRRKKRKKNPLMNEKDYITGGLVARWKSNRWE